MQLEFTGELEFDAQESAFWWVCGNDDVCLVADYWQDHPIPAPEYDWLYWCATIPEEDFKQDPELRQECEQMRQQYLNRPLSRKSTSSKPPRAHR